MDQREKAVKTSVIVLENHPRLRCLPLHLCWKLHRVPAVSIRTGNPIVMPIKKFSKRPIIIVRYYTALAVTTLKSSVSCFLSCSRELQELPTSFQELVSCNSNYLAYISFLSQITTNQDGIKSTQQDPNPARTSRLHTFQLKMSNHYGTVRA